MVLVVEASARHAETSALTQPIAKASPPRYCRLGCCGVLFNLASAAEELVATALSARDRARAVLACVCEQWMHEFGSYADELGLLVSLQAAS